MNSYAAIFLCRISALFQYRAAALAGLSTQLFWGFVKVMILTAFYAGSTSVQPLSLAQAISFTWLSQALLQLLPWNLDKELEAQVKTGNVAYELLRPLDLYWLWFVRALAMRILPTIMRAIPVFIVSGLFLDLSAPVSLNAAVAFLVSLLFGSWVAAAITTLVIISLFWTISGEGVQRLMPSVALLFSGMIVPLPLFPDWAQSFLNLQPFRCVIDIPCRLYTGVIPVGDAPYYMALQIAWALILIAVGRVLMRKAVSRMVIQGG